MAAMTTTVKVHVHVKPRLSWLDALKLRLAGPQLRRALIERIMRQAERQP